MARPPRTLLAPVIVVGLVALSACTPDASSTEGGFGLPRLPAAEAAGLATDAERLNGALRVASDGCFLFAVPGDSAAAAHGTWIVWPEGAEADGDDVILADGTRLGDGDPLTVAGQVVELAALPDGASAQSYFGSFGRFCGADERRVLVVTAMTADG